MKRAKRILALLTGVAMMLSLLGAIAEQEMPNDELTVEQAVEAIEEAPAEGQADDASTEPEAEPEPEAPAGDSPEVILLPDAEDAEDSGFGMDGDVLVVYSGAEEDVVIPDGVKVIGPVAFCQLPNLRSVVIPAGVERIGSYAFADCENLEEVVLPEGLKAIEDHAFQNCPKLKGLALPEGLETIGTEAFQGCEALGEIAIPAGAEVAEDSALPEQVIVEPEGDIAPVEGVELDAEAGDGQPAALEDEEGFRIVNPVGAIGVKEYYTLRASIEDEGNKWTSDKEKYVKIVNSATGEIRGVKRGKATITVTTPDGQTASTVVQVLAAPSKVSLNTKKGTLGVNETVQLTAKLPKKTASNSITWASNHPEIAKVDDDGLVTAVSTGKAKITVQTFNRKKASYTVTVKAEPEQIAVKEALTLGKGQKYTLNISLDPSTASGKLKIENDDDKVLKLDKKELRVSGKSSIKLTALAEGSTTLRFKLYNGATAECKVTVCAVPTTLKIVNAVSLGVKETYQLRAESNTDPSLMMHAKWKSSNKKIIAVNSQTGELTAKKKGTATITVTLPKGKKTIKKSAKIKVIGAATGITLNQTSAELNAGETLQLTAEIPKKTASQIQWASDDDRVASVDENGLVTAVGGGEAIITASTFNGYSASCAVTVLGAGAPVISINGVVANNAVREVFDSVDLAWSSEEPVVSYDVKIAGDDGSVLFEERGTNETGVSIPKEQMTSGTTYTITVSATLGYGEPREVSRKFMYIDPTADFDYELTEEGATITGYKGSAENVTVPDKLDGKAVTRIAAGAFNGANCAKITSIHWPENVVFEEDSVAGLKGCADANSFLVFNGILCEYFGKASSITVPAGVVRINDGAFAQNTTLTSAKLPNTVKTIGARAFADCSKLKTMTTY